MSTTSTLEQPVVAAPGIDQAAFRKVLGTFSTGVTIITTKDADGTPVGVTANSFNSVSLDPPLVLWSLAKKSSSLSAFTNTSHWAVHILAHDQHHLSGRFARSTSGIEKFNGIECETGVGNVPLLSGCASRMQCRTAHLYEGGDHIIIVGEVLRFDSAGAPPLVFQEGSYAIATSLKQEPPPANEDPRNVSSDGSLGYLLASASLHYNARFYELTGKWDLTRTELLLLSALQAREPRTYAELTTLVRYGGQPVGVEVLNDLAARGLLRVNDDSTCDQVDDAAEIVLTEDGRVLAESIRQQADALDASVIAQIGPADTVALRNLLSRFVRIYDPRIAYRWF